MRQLPRDAADAGWSAFALLDDLRHRWPRHVPDLEPAELQVWSSHGILHDDPDCPAAASTGAWIDVSFEDLGEHCGVCGAHAPNLDLTTSAGTYSPTVFWLQWAHLQTLNELVRRGDNVALTQATQVSGRLQRCLDELDTLESIRDLAQADIDTVTIHRTSERRRRIWAELIRRWLCWPHPEQQIDDPDDPAWKAVRWAIRRASDPLLAADATGFGLSPSGAAALRDLDRRADDLSCAPRVIVFAASAVAVGGGVRGDICLSLGLATPGHPKTSAVELPAPLAHALEPGLPGVLVKTAGMLPSHDGRSELLEVAAGLWTPGSSGPLKSPTAALAAAALVCLPGSDTTAADIDAFEVS